MGSIIWFFLGFNRAGRSWNGGWVLPGDGLVGSLLQMKERSCLEIGATGVGDVGGVEEVFLNAVRSWWSPGRGGVAGGGRFGFG